MKRSNFIKSLLVLPLIGTALKNVASTPVTSIVYRKVTFPSGKVLTEKYFLRDGVPVKAEVPFAYDTNAGGKTQYYVVINTDKSDLDSFQNSIDNVFARNDMNYLESFHSYWDYVPR